MDLAKGFGTINYKLLVAKLNAYGFRKETDFQLIKEQNTKS